MENSSNALLMAGGILLAIIVITIFVISYSNIMRFQNEKIEKKQLEDITSFNEQFLSYNKNVMYGTDLISVLNLALDNNKKYNVSYGEEYYVNISFTLIDNLYDITNLYKINNETAQYEKISNDDYPYKEPRFYGNKKYELCNDNDKKDIENNLIRKLNEKEQITENKEVKGKIIISYTIKNNYIYDLKRKTFTCTGIEMDQEGKVKAMSFEQK